MRIVFIILACTAILLGIVFVVLPMGSIAVVPAVAGVLFAYLAFRKSEVGYKNPPKILLIIAVLLIIVGVSKHFLVKTEVAKDDSFEERVEDSQKEAIEELDSLEDELEDLPE